MQQLSYNFLMDNKGKKKSEFHIFNMIWNTYITLETIYLSLIYIYIYIKVFLNMGRGFDLK